MYATVFLTPKFKEEIVIFGIDNRINSKPPKQPKMSHCKNGSKSYAQTPFIAIRVHNKSTRQKTSIDNIKLNKFLQ